MDSEKLENQALPPETNDTDANDLPNMNRRSFFTKTLLGGGAAIAAGGAAVGASRASLQGKIDPVGIEYDGDVKPMDQRDVLFTATRSKALAEKFADRDEQFTRLQKLDYLMMKEGRQVMYKRIKPDDSRPGYTQVDRAFSYAGGWPLQVTGSIASMSAQPDTILYSWDQSTKAKEEYDFGSDERKKNVILSAARGFGALRVGITKFDKRHVYDPLYSIKEERTISWDEFPFKPKSVIVMAVGMDYDGAATSPSWTHDGTARVSYTYQAMMASQMAHFVRLLGYHASGAGNDMGNSVAMAISAGLGEGGRNNTCIMPGVGPRARLCKVFTDIDFGDEYDQPRTWGIKEFCKSCMKCADACPSGAVSTDVEPSFYPTYEFSDEPGYTWNNWHGVKKWHPDSKKCFNFWLENDGSCGNCLAACTFNEPDFWHHWLIMAVNPAMPKFVHSLMADAHPAFGYGGQTVNPKPDKVDKFWESGKGMRVNLSNKNNLVTSGQS